MNRQSEIRVLTIIVTYNAMRWIERCLDSLRHSTIQTDILVIDNGSSDDTIAYIQQNYPEVEILPQTQNLGFGQANNIGLQKVLSDNYDFALLLNQDAWIEPTMISDLLPYDNGHRLLSPTHLNGTGTRIDQNFYNHALRCSDINIQSITETDHSKIFGLHKTDFINAACWLLSRSIIEQIGGFNPLFFHYCEDSNYVHRLLYHGIDVCFVGDTFVYHDREKRKRKKSSFIHIKQAITLHLTNINLSQKQALISIARYFLTALHLVVLERNIAIIGYYLKALFTASQEKKEIISSRAKERILQPNWLPYTSQCK